MEKPLFTLLGMQPAFEPDRDQPPVTNYAPVSPLGLDACGVRKLVATKNEFTAVPRHQSDRQERQTHSARGRLLIQ